MRSVSCKDFARVVVPVMLATMSFVTLSPHVAYAQEGVLKPPICVTSACTKGELEQMEDENEEGSFMQLMLHVSSSAETGALEATAKSAAVQDLARHDEEENDITLMQSPVQMMLPWVFGGLYGNLTMHYPQLEKTSSTKCIDDHYVYYDPTLTSYWEFWKLQGVQNISGVHIPPRCHKRQMQWLPPMLRSKSMALVTSSRLTKFQTISEIVSSKLRSLSAPVWVGIIYATLLFILLAYLFHSFTSQSQVVKDSSKNEYGANQSWNTSIFHWLFLSWATPWVAKWGNAENSDITKVKPDELGPLGGKEDLAAPQYAKFQQLWVAEIEEVGLEKADLFKVLKKMIGRTSMFSNWIWLLIFNVSFYFVPPLCVQFASSCLEEYYIKLDNGESLDNGELTLQCLLFVLVLTGLPLIQAFSRGVSKMVNARICTNITGALSMAVLDKALRMPVSSLQELSSTGTATSAEATGGADASTSSSTSADDKISGSKIPLSEGESETNVNEEKYTASESKEEGKAVPPPAQKAEQVAKYHLAQLVMNDINDVITKGQFQFVRAISFTPVIIGLFTYAACQLGTAALWVTLFMFIAVCCVLMIAINMAGNLRKLFAAQGKRLEAFQNYIFGIRFIKSSGFEEVVQSILEGCHAEEISLLAEYFTRLGYMSSIMAAFPRLLLTVAFVSYILTYGEIKAASIMLFIPLVTLLNNSLSAMMDLLPSIAGALASLERVQHFLKQPESPGLHFRDTLPVETTPSSIVPDFIELWPKSGDTPLVVKGDFSWNQHSEPVLKDLNITIPRGNLVAVLGAVGSGKTSLLHSILGELYPQGNAEVKRPKIMAYSAQVANIIEGNLKDNVVFGYEYKEERFKEVIHNSCLLPDLELLPGGVEVPVGSRGISLSGGQKARVSIARAAYSIGTDVVLLDDPFAAVDTHTSAFIAKHYLRSKVMEGRTQIVVCQPEASLIEKFDQVLVLEDGVVKEQGTPYQVMQTSAYKDLLASVQVHSAAVASQEQETTDGGAQAKKPLGAGAPTSLREEESQGRASWDTVKYFLRSGGHWRFACNFTLVSFSVVLGQIVMLILSQWVSVAAAAENDLGPPVDNFRYIWTQFGVTLVSVACYIGAWIIGVKFSLNMSRFIHHEVLDNILHAPVDKFFDRTPVGRIVNRMTTDMPTVDKELFMNLSNSLLMVTSVVFPLVLVHLVTPWWFTLLCVPGYIYSCLLVKKYWATMVPIRYLVTTVKSLVDVELSEVENSNATVRAYNKCKALMEKFQGVMDDHIKCDFSTIAILEQWVLLRLFFFGAGLQTSLGLLALLAPQVWNLGLANMAISNVVTTMISIEYFVTMTCQVQYKFIALDRVHAYTSLPREKDFVVKGDYRYTSFQIKIVARAELGHLKMRGTSIEGVQILRQSRNGKEEVLLEQVKGQAAFKAFSPNAEAPKTLAVLGMRGDYEFDPDHRIAAVNGIRGDAEKMAMELCKLDDPSGPVSLHVVSGWLADGAQVEIKGLVAGYADMAKNVLQDINVVIPRRAKAGFVGKTGCGKSTTILCLVRILEPRAGTITIENVDTASIGLKTLRQAIGLVPQDPTLMVGTLRSNLDMFGQYSDESIWQALNDMQLSDYVKSQKDELNMEIAGDGGNLSFGQRQLLCLARMALQQPALLLLDEATSAVDPATQQLVQDTIEQRFPNSTMIVIAHRLETIINFDLVVVLKAGRIVEKGPVKELANQSGGIFASMLAARRK